MGDEAGLRAITATCRRCGSSFSYQRFPRQRPRWYCSPACRSGRRVDEQRAARDPLRCRHCGAALDLSPTGGRVRTTYCSDRCKEQRRSELRQAALEARHAGRLCRQCGEPIPLALSTRALTCSPTCGVQYGNATRSERARLARSQRPRPPCSVCGSAIDPSRRRNVVYCSEACKRVAVAVKYRTRNPDAQLARYEMRPGEYDALLATQGGRCAICGALEAGGKGGRFHVDHDHRTGRIRGLLCHGCNLGIGMLRDSPDVMRSAIAYLEGVSDR